MENVTPSGDGPPPPDDDKAASRRHALVVLVLRHLRDEGYSQAYAALCGEARITLSQLDVADNINLSTVVSGYEEFYLAKYGRRPKLMRRLSGDFQPPIRTSLTPHSASPYGGDQKYVMVPGGVQGLVSGAVMMQGGGDGRHGRPSTTLRLGSGKPVAQEELVAQLDEMVQPDPSLHFSFERPKRNTSKKRSSLLSLEEMHEDVLYALVGCTNVGWSIKSISNQSKDFLANRCGITKDLLQLFFKNRAQRPKRQRSGRKSGASLPPSHAPGQTSPLVPPALPSLHPHLSPQGLHPSGAGARVGAGQPNPLAHINQLQPLGQLQPPFHHPGGLQMPFQTSSQPFQSPGHSLPGLGLGTLQGLGALQ
ncbi:unnamed protein product, partial [Ostreobium quekettii]